MRKCNYCGEYDFTGDKDSWCMYCTTNSLVEVEEARGFELVDVADPIFEEEEYWITKWLRKYHPIEYAKLGEPVVLDAPLAFIEDKPEVVTSIAHDYSECGNKDSNGLLVDVRG